MNGNDRDMQSKADVNTHEPHDSIDTDNTNSTGIFKDAKETEST